MKFNNIKKVKKEFDPTTHWYSFLLLFCFVFLIIVAYGTYSFFYIRNQIVLISIEAANGANSGDIAVKSKENKDMMKGILTLNAKLEEFAAKEKAYDAFVKTLPVTSSTTVATSTN